MLSAEPHDGAEHDSHLSWRLLDLVPDARRWNASGSFTVGWVVVWAIIAGWAPGNINIVALSQQQ